MLIEVVFLCCIAILLFKVFHLKTSDLPPGEWGLPIIGCLPKRGQELIKTIRKLRDKHGNIFCMKIGSNTMVCLCDYSTMKTALSKPELSGRPYLFTNKIAHHFMNLGILVAERIVWLTNRRFAIKVLKDFGLGKSKLEHIINIEVKNLVEHLQMEVDKPTEIEWYLNVAVLNVLWGLVAGRRFDINDEEIKKLSQMLNENLANQDGLPRLLDFYPVLEYILPKFARKWMKINVLENVRDRLLDFISKEANNHREGLDKNNPRDYIDMYLIEVEKEKENPNSTFRQDLRDLGSSLHDLFLAGSETTSTSIRWYFLYMAKYPGIQEKIQREIDSVVSRDRFPNLEDKERLPYFEASIYESLRIVSLVPNSVMHCALDNTVINGFRIPKGTIIIPCLSICNHSPDYWERPDEFYPDHFIDENGKFYIRKEGFLPFSIGRRQCLGESLAKMELYFFLGAILQTFKISEPEGQNATLEPNPEVRLMNQPQSFKIILKKRK